MARRSRRTSSGITIEAIVPMKLNTSAMTKVIYETVVESAKLAKKDFEKTVTTWKNKPQMETRVGGVGRLLSGKARLDFSAGPNPYGDNYDIYKFVDLGTKKHLIPKTGNTTAKPLFFQWAGKGSYNAKTKPRVIGSTGGGATGAWRTFKQVKHPGTKARQFSSIIARKWQKKLPKDAQKAMDKATQVSGHSMRRKRGR